MQDMAVPRSPLVPRKLAFKSLCSSTHGLWTRTNAISEFPAGPQVLFSLFLLSVPSGERATQTRPTHLETSLSFFFFWNFLSPFFLFFCNMKLQLSFLSWCGFALWLLCVKVRLRGLKSPAYFPSSGIPYTDTGFVAALLTESSHPSLSSLSARDDLCVAISFSPAWG